MYFHVLKISQLAFHFSMLNKDLVEKSIGVSDNHITSKDIGITRAIANLSPGIDIHDAHVKVKPLEMSLLQTTLSQLPETLLHQYKTQLIRQAFHIFAGQIVNKVGHKRLRPPPPKRIRRTDRDESPMQ
eukprot:TRINITY_DN11987_c0_g1_i3.p1 TRINITY_DN11987_c0_g1~~TRINITY_DN11987_c0_g1_i3.p1  ORF type:complete len:129 (-),score=27.34 TRINITY_DN11987_c0_g1_i3:103-489(-)